ncbi:hypothetical protein B5P45_16765 [Phyllobacterium zundukense]|uniref:Uncharacterized protein n=1 Tax=Phyllobacterium zundukense TaxID=1867719 RepID=A0A2N9VVP9_9HYPH|nr:hypothetical protein BLM14_06380 [Phyllobacterium zundukense]PIO43567.1 hypothetical protein B5P45_16765 [Phyllobacterium zundukense]
MRENGVDQGHAEAHAGAARDLIMSELVTKSDLSAALTAQTLALTLRLGVMMAVGFSVLATLMKIL